MTNTLKGRAQYRKRITVGQNYELRYEAKKVDVTKAQVMKSF